MKMEKGLTLVVATLGGRQWRAGSTSEGYGRKNLLDLLPSEAEQSLRDFAAASGEPSFRAAQVMRHLWINPVADFSDMTVLPAGFRARLAEAFEIPRLELAARQTSADGTEKFLFRLRDGEFIETVAIPDVGLTLCISRRPGRSPVAF